MAGDLLDLYVYKVVRIDMDGNPISKRGVKYSTYNPLVVGHSYFLSGLKGLYRVDALVNVISD